MKKYKTRDAAYADPNYAQFHYWVHSGNSAYGVAEDAAEEKRFSQLLLIDRDREMDALDFEEDKTGNWNFDSLLNWGDDYDNSPPLAVEENCKHLKRKIVKHMTFAYHYCPDCKADLGDA